jgi:hypothetical protein
MKKKYESIGLALLIFIVVPSVLAVMMNMWDEPVEPRYGPPHNYWVPQDGLDIVTDTEAVYIIPTDEDIMMLDTVLNQVNNIEKDLDTCFLKIESIESKIDVLIKSRNKH